MDGPAFGRAVGHGTTRYGDGRGGAGGQVFRGNFCEHEEAEEANVAGFLDVGYRGFSDRNGFESVASTEHDVIDGRLASYGFEQGREPCFEGLRVRKVAGVTADA